MLQKISRNRATRRKEVLAFINEADRMISTYGWEEKTVFPYSFPVKVTKIIDDLRCFDNCSESSKDYLVSLANGLPNLMNHWEERELEPQVRVRFTNTGREKTIPQSDVDTFTELFEGFIEILG